MQISLEDKYAVICGSTQGIGLAIAKEFAEAGANCVLMARNKEALEKAISQLQSSDQQNHQYLVADFSKPAESYGSWPFGFLTPIKQDSKAATATH